MIEIDVANDFTDAPGPRFKNQGEFSGELFREKLLIPKFEEAMKKDTELLINLDGTFGYPTSFLEEAFGGLKEKYSPNVVLKIINFISNDEIGLVDEIKGYIRGNE